MLDVIGTVSFNQAITRRVRAVKRILFAGIEDVCVEDVCVEDDHRPNLIGSTGKPRHSWVGSSMVAPRPRKKATEVVPNPTAGVSFSTWEARRISGLLLPCCAWRGAWRRAFRGPSTWTTIAGARGPSPLAPSLTRLLFEPRSLSRSIPLPYSLYFTEQP
jgi:hypothetical protein